MSEAAPVFNPKKPFATKRVYEGSQSLIQNGHEFTLRHDYVGVDPDQKAPEKEAAKVPTPEVIQVPELPLSPEETTRQSVLRRAQSKLSDFTAPDDPSGSGKENGQAAAAERYAE